MNQRPGEQQPQGGVPAAEPESVRLERELAADPTNLELAWRYWRLLGRDPGRDVRSGAYVFRAFRPAALASPAGMVAFTRAYHELFCNSAEPPRLLDAALLRAF